MSLFNISGWSGNGEAAVMNVANIHGSAQFKPLSSMAEAWRSLNPNYLSVKGSCSSTAITPPLARQSLPPFLSPNKGATACQVAVLFKCLCSGATMPCHFIICFNNTKVDGPRSRLFLCFFLKCSLIFKGSFDLLLPNSKKPIFPTLMNNYLLLYSTSEADQGIFTNI